jgi:cephalosporin-C deacetylase-like acetyl esterase
LQAASPRVQRTAWYITLPLTIVSVIEPLNRSSGFVEPTTVEYLETIVNRVTDLRRGLDCLETRRDVDASRVAFFGPSAGAQIGLIAAAVETRYRAVVLVGAGLPN